MSTQRTAPTRTIGDNCGIISLLSDDDESVPTLQLPRPPRPTRLPWEERGHLHQQRIISSQSIKHEGDNGIKNEGTPATDSKAAVQWDAIRKALEETRNPAALNSKSAIFKCFIKVRRNLERAFEKCDLLGAESALEELNDITPAVWNEINRKMQ